MRRWAAALAVVLVLAGGLGALVARSARGGPSTLSRGGEGWSLAWHYLEARGVELARADRPPDPVASPGALVLAFPWSARRAEVPEQALRELLRAGGDLVVAWQGAALPGAGEGRVLDVLGVGTAREPLAPAAPLAWWREARADVAVQAPSGERLGAIRRPLWRPLPPEGREVLLADAAGRPLGWWWRHGSGRVVLLPAELLANARLAGGQSAGVLESLHRWLGPQRWVFDEYHHGLIAAELVAAGSGGRRGLDLFLAHLGLLWVAALLTLARRMGPAWREPAPTSGTAAAFLRRVAVRHDRLGHHAEAAARLLERARRLDPRLVVPAAADQRARAAGPDDLVALARWVAGKQRRGAE